MRLYIFKKSTKIENSSNSLSVLTQPQNLSNKLIPTINQIYIHNTGSVNTTTTASNETRICNLLNDQYHWTRSHLIKIVYKYFDSTQHTSKIQKYHFEQTSYRYVKTFIAAVTSKSSCSYQYIYIDNK